nr:hypothetical protein [Labrenzia sp. DG1229]
MAIATPYLDEVNDREKNYLQDRGFEVTRICGLNLRHDSEMVRVRPERIADFAKAVDTTDAEAVFISCGALRSLDIVDELEQTLKKPVISSNQAMAWDILRLLGIRDRVAGYGTLMRSC